MIKRNIQLVEAKPGDEEIILDLLYPGYFNETVFSNMEFDRDQCLETIQVWLNHSIVAAAVIDGVFAGFGVLTLSKSFYKQTEADIEMFCIKPEFRGSGASRAIRDILIETAKANEVKLMYASCLSGMGETNEKLFINLWKKAGFKKLGTMMMGSL